MPLPGKRWRHVIINTHCSWLHGDERGFRDRHHRIHSSGDYKHRPPPDEHAGLRRYYEEHCGEPVIIPPEARHPVGEAIVENLRGQNHRLLVVSVSGLHAHALVELPDDVPVLKRIIGWCKWKSSVAVRDRMPGVIWARGETYKPVDSRAHLRSAFKYIRDMQGEGAWVWVVPWNGA